MNWGYRTDWIITTTGKWEPSAAYSCYVDKTDAEEIEFLASEWIYDFVRYEMWKSAPKNSKDIRRGAGRIQFKAGGEADVEKALKLPVNIPRAEYLRRLLGTRRLTALTLSTLDSSFEELEALGLYEYMKRPGDEHNSNPFYYEV